MLFKHHVIRRKIIPVCHPAVSFVTPVLALSFKKKLCKFHRLNIVPHFNSHLSLLMCLTIKKNLAVSY